MLNQLSNDTLTMPRKFGLSDSPFRVADWGDVTNNVLVQYIKKSVLQLSCSISPMAQPNFKFEKGRTEINNTFLYVAPNKHVFRY
jgi:hypothetical protein